MAIHFHFGKQPLQIRSESVFNRDLFLFECENIDELALPLVLPSQYFVCLLVLDATEFTEAQIRALASKLLKAGCAYMCCWGPGCERVHDLFDLVDLEVRPDGPYAMTTWHSRDSLEEAIWFSLFVTWPDEAFAEECLSTIAIVVNSSEWAAEVRTAFDDPQAFEARIKPESMEPDTGDV